MSTGGDLGILRSHAIAVSLVTIYIDIMVLARYRASEFGVALILGLIAALVSVILALVSDATNVLAVTNESLGGPGRRLALASAFFAALALLVVVTFSLVTVVER